MKKIFDNIPIKIFNAQFTDKNACLKFLADQKWQNEFVCKKCGHTNFCKGKTPYSRRCTKCKSEESATAHTMFHRCHIPLTTAFKIAYLVCNEPKISSYELSRLLDTRQMTCWKFKSKIAECIENSNEYSMVEKVELKNVILEDRNDDLLK